MKFLFIALLAFLVCYFLVFAGVGASFEIGGNVFGVRTVLSLGIAALVGWKFG